MNIKEQYQTVDFSNPGLRSWGTPVSCSVQQKPIPVGSSWGDLLVNLIEYFLKEGNPHLIHNLLRKGLTTRSTTPFFKKKRPDISMSARLLSNGYWININHCVRSLIGIIGSLCSYFDVELDNVIIRCCPKSETSRVKKNDIEETNNDEYLNDDGQGNETDKQTAIVQLCNTIESIFPDGIKKDSTSIRLLSRNAKIEISSQLENILFSSMFHRGDNIYFLRDSAILPTVQREIIFQAHSAIEEHNCFEIAELYKYFQNKINQTAIRDVTDFENYFKILYPNMFCTAPSGFPKIRIVRNHSMSIDQCCTDIAKTVTSLTNNEFGGTITEDDLLNTFQYCSASFFDFINRRYMREFVKTTINGIICYQTYAALGFSDDFSDIISVVLDQITHLNLTPSEDVLHAFLSIKKNVNFNDEYGIPDFQSFRNLIEFYYKSEPKRAWKGGVFGEVLN